MIIVNAILYLSPAWYSSIESNILIDLLREISTNINFLFTENIIFPSIAENEENIIFMLSAFTKMLFHAVEQWIEKSITWFQNLSYASKGFFRKLLAIKMKRTKEAMNKPMNECSSFTNNA